MIAMTTIFVDILPCFFGAVFGGSAAWFVARSQTGRVLDQERQLAEAFFEAQRRLTREGADELRTAQRDGRAKDAAVELLNLLTELWLILPALRSDYLSVPERQTHEKAVLERIRVANLSIAQLLPDDIPQRWDRLVSLVEEAEHAKRSLHMRAPTDWTREKVDRANEDVNGYFGYVQRTLVALAKGVQVSASAPAPVLRRSDMGIWQAPDEPYFTSAAG
jgi:hypothetical protein